MLNGFMLPNYEWMDWTEAQLAQTISLNPSVLLIPLYENSNPFSAQKRLDIFLLRRRLPSCQFLYRIMGENNMLRDPIQWAAETRERLEGLPQGGVIPTNEDNIEGVGENWARMLWWWKAYLAQMTAYSVHLSALSPVGNYREGWQVLEQLASLVAVVDIHIYPGNEADIEAASQYFGDAVLYITEYNRIMPTSMAAQAQAHSIQAIIWFILAGTFDQQQYALVEPYLSDFRKVNTVAAVQRKYTHGCDISSNNGKVADWEQLARCIDFIEIKANEWDYTNPYFKESWKAAADHGLVRVAYDFARPSLGSGHDEAMRFLDVVAANGGIHSGDIPMLDMEDLKVPDGADLLAYVIDWAQTVTAQWGAKPWLYSADWYLKPHNLEGHIELADYGLNYAQYGTTPPTVPLPWTYWTVWQYSDSGTLPGIVRAVDLDLFNGTLEQLRKYGKP